MLKRIHRHIKRHITPPLLYGWLIGFFLFLSLLQTTIHVIGFYKECVDFLEQDTRVSFMVRDSVKQEFENERQNYKFIPIEYED